MKRGDSPVVASIPHSGTRIPGRIGKQLEPPGLALRDTDWWLDQLYDFLHELNVTVVRTEMSRTVIDLNRDPSGASLYPGIATTTLCPTTTFDGIPFYRTVHEPDEAEVGRRHLTWFQPYHEAVRREIDRLSALHGTVVLYDCHSIRSVVPRLFTGELPHVSIGTNDGSSCSPELASLVAAAFSGSDYACVTNGRFKGGWITREYGAPRMGVHAIQVELACRTYMNEVNGNYPAPYS
ncbi:N-formylglutamate deformylase [Methylobacterium sp. BTF04]|uniref:N-formylglutamate deformylase n=1 Tax=Methylobacterium sp. BTF04 TaxID=2708300 RepID=UPI0019542D6F